MPDITPLPVSAACNIFENLTEQTRIAVVIKINTNTKGLYNSLST